MLFFRKINSSKNSVLQQEKTKMRWSYLLLLVRPAAANFSSLQSNSIAVCQFNRRYTASCKIESTFGRQVGQSFRTCSKMMTKFLGTCKFDIVKRSNLRPVCFCGARIQFYDVLEELIFCRLCYSIFNYDVVRDQKLIIFSAASIILRRSSRIWNTTWSKCDVNFFRECVIAIDTQWRPHFF